MMQRFSKFISEDNEPNPPHKSEDGTTVYSHTIGPHTVHTIFYPRQNDKGTKDYDMHFVRTTEGKKNNGFSRQGMSDMESSHRVKAIRSVIKSARHFISNEKPDSIIASANTKKKSSIAKSTLGHIAGSNGQIKQSGHDTTVNFKNNT